MDPFETTANYIADSSPETSFCDDSSDEE